MKIKKALVAILTLSICLSMLAVIPTVSAAGNSVWENVVKEGGYRNDIGVRAPEDYEWINVDGNSESHLVTKETYNAFENTIVLKDLNVPVGSNIAIVYSPDKSGVRQAHANRNDGADGVFTFFLTNTGTAYEYSTYFFDGGNGPFVFSSNQLGNCTIPYADEYKIGFVVDGGNVKFHINDWYMSQWIYGLSGAYSAENGNNRYITVGTDSRASANIRIASNDEIGSPVWENLVKEGGYRDGTDVKAPEGYEYISVNSDEKSQVVTKKVYNVREKTIVLKDLNVPVGKHIAFVFSPHQAKFGERPATGSSAKDGLFTFYLYNDGTKYIYHTYFYDGGNGPFDFSFQLANSGTNYEIPYADEYEISFVNRFDSTDCGYGGNVLRINNCYIRDWIGGLAGEYSQNNGFERYLTITTDDRASANVKIVSNDDMRNRWVAIRGRLQDYNGAVYNDSKATALKIAGGTSGVASIPKYNMLENTLVLDNVKFSEATSSGQWTDICFSATTRESDNHGTSNNDVKQNLAFKLEPYNYNADGSVANVRLVWNNYAGGLTEVSVSDRYEIGFRNINGSYFMFVNNEKFSNEWITNFCTNKCVENCYIGFFSVSYFCADMTVVDNNERNGEWINTQGVFHKNIAGGTDDYRRVTSTDSIVTIPKYDLLHGNMTLKNASFSLETKENGSYYNNLISFGTYGSIYEVTTPGALVCTTLIPKTVNNGVLKKVDVCVRNSTDDGYGLITLGTIDAATDYTYSFAKEADKYYLYVNGTKMAENAYINELGAAGILEDCYVSLWTEQSFTAAPVFNESTWEQVAGADIANWTVAAADGASNVTLPSGAYIRQNATFDIRDTKVIIDNLDCGYDADVDTNPLAVLTFAKNQKVIGAAPATGKSMSFGFSYVWDEQNGEEFIKVFYLNYNGVWVELGNVETANSYEISIAYSLSDDGYCLNINNEKIGIINNDDAINFFENNGKDVYVIFGAENYDVIADKVTVSKTSSNGDANNDGVRDIEDMVMVARGMANNNNKADANQDGKVDINDIGVIRKLWFANGYNYVQ